MDKNEFVDLGKDIWKRMFQKKDGYSDHFVNLKNDEFCRKDSK